MSLINVLDPQVANLIAAGEVVDRPGSVVKELVENAIDAGASNITVEVRNGGISFIRVTDDGTGMEHDDVPLCLRRHATSKIKCANDLDAISTLGFRGEALAAISSVSKVKIFTKRPFDELGTILSSEGPMIIDCSEAGCQNGTTIIVEELFFNVPARRKFLKKDSSESLYVNAVMERMALSRPEIKFKYITDNTVKFTTPGTGKMLDAIYAVLGRDIVNKSISVYSKDDNLEVDGYIGAPELTRGSTNMQMFFINRRFVKCKTAYAALRQAYDSYIPHGRFPVCVINIRLDPRRVDVNVHPSKLEVNFADERAVFDIIFYAVRSALVKGLPTPKMQMPQKRDASNAFSPIPPSASELKKNQITINDIMSSGRGAPVQKREQTPSRTVDFSETRDKKSDYMRSSYSMLESPKIERKIETFIPPKEDYSWDDLTVQSNELPEELLPLPDYKIIGELFYSYVVVELSDKVLFIDKHAAHERILFEEMKRNIHSQEKSTQLLMLPIEVPLDNESFAALESNIAEVRRTGLEIDLDREKLTASVTAAPEVMLDDDITAFVGTLAAALAGQSASAGVLSETVYEKALYQASCKAAIKAGRIYDESSLKWICDRLLVLPNIKYCPHGRPVAIEMSKYDFEKQFKRI